MIFCRLSPGLRGIIKVFVFHFKSRIPSTEQSASIPDNNLTKDEQQALKRLKNDDNIVILPADKGRVTVVMNKNDYFDKMDALVCDKQTYEELKRDPTSTLLRKLNSKLLTLKKTDAIDTQRYYLWSRGGLMVSALDSGASAPGSSPGRGHCVVFLGKTLYSHGASLNPGV